MRQISEFALIGGPKYKIEADESSICVDDYASEAKKFTKNYEVEDGYQDKVWCNFYLRHIMEYRDVDNSSEEKKRGIIGHCKYIFLADYSKYGLLWDMENKRVLLWRFSEITWPPKEPYPVASSGADLVSMENNNHRLYYIGHNKILHPDRKLNLAKYQKEKRFNIHYAPEIPNFVSRQYQERKNSSQKRKLEHGDGDKSVAKKEIILEMPQPSIKRRDDDIL